MNAFTMLMQHISNLFTWIVIVAPWEQAIRVRLGKNVRLLGAGVYLRIPFIDRVYRQTIRQRMFVVRPQVLTTKDGVTLTLSGAIGFQIVDLCKLFNTLHDAMDTIESEIASVIAEYVSTSHISECHPEKIEQRVAERVSLLEYGMSGQKFRLTNYAVVKAYRFVTGELPSWSNNSIDTGTRD